MRTQLRHLAGLPVLIRLLVIAGVLLDGNLIYIGVCQGIGC